ncbi:DUF1366 domain-containing protein [Streptococcus pluranimalium]|uniref:DUF1366 domain-containing protein n=1 Tax=Streptococcus pluranimalium TaxID=82348 RepID=UPI0039FC5FCD
MRNWTVVGKYPIYDDENKISHTEIVIASTSNGYATFTERVAGDHLNKTEKELITLALDGLFKSEFSDRAMAESVRKIDELEIITKDAKKFMKEAEEKIVSMETSQTELLERLEVAEKERNDRFKVVEDKFQILNGSVMEMLTEFYASSEEGVEDESFIEEPDTGNHVGGSDNPTDNTETETE